MFSKSGTRCRMLNAFHGFKCNRWSIYNINIVSTHSQQMSNYSKVIISPVTARVATHSVEIIWLHTAMLIYPQIQIHKITAPTHYHLCKLRYTITKIHTAERWDKHVHVLKHRVMKKQNSSQLKNYIYFSAMQLNIWFRRTFLYCFLPIRKAVCRCYTC